MKLLFSVFGRILGFAITSINWVIFFCSEFSLNTHVFEVSLVGVEHQISVCCPLTAGISLILTAIPVYIATRRRRLMFHDADPVEGIDTPLLPNTER